MKHYRSYIYKAAVGWCADVTWYVGGDRVGLGGPCFWRPTERWVKRRAARHIRRRMAMHRMRAVLRER